MIRWLDAAGAVMRLDPFADSEPFPEAPPARPPSGSPEGTAYARFFSLHELAASRPLQWLAGALLLGYFVTFYEWAGDRGFTVEAAAQGRHRCWPYFQGCGDWYFLSALPEGYSQTFAYMIAFVLLTAAAVAWWRKAWTLVHALMLPLFLWKVLVYFVFSMGFTGNYHVFHLVFSAILLCFPYKLYFLRRTLVFLYILAATIKIHEGWILGTYFTSLRLGAPLVPDALTPVVTNAVFVLETVGAFLLLSEHPRRQRLALLALIVFHLYSGILVKYMYPTMVLPPLLILFGPRYQRTDPPFDRLSLPGWMLMILAAAAQAITFVIPGDVKLTLEGNYYGLYMFEANHQCVSTTEVHRQDGTVKTEREESASARRRCNPYAVWFELVQDCRRRGKKIERVGWRFDHSINGGPFYRLVDEVDACQLRYAPFRHNTWIHLPEEGAPVMGYPVRNFYD